MKEKLRKRSKEKFTNNQEILRQLLLQVKEEQKPSEYVLTMPTGREIIIVVIDPKKAFSDVTAVIGEAHADDAVLGEGINIISSEIGVGVTYITMTDGSARELDGYDSPKDLALQRRHENVEAAKKAGAAMVINLGYRDSELQINKEEATQELRAILDVVKPLYIIAPNKHDPHNDHTAAYRILKGARSSGKSSLYGTDTQTTQGRGHFSLRPTHFFKVSQQVKSRRDEEYDTHISQVNVIDRTDVDQVFALSEVRGAQNGWKYGGVLFKAKFSKDTLTPLLRQNGIEVKKQTSPKVIYTRMKNKLGLAA